MHLFNTAVYQELLLLWLWATSFTLNKLGLLVLQLPPTVLLWLICLKETCALSHIKSEGSVAVYGFAFSIKNTFLNPGGVMNSRGEMGQIYPDCASFLLGDKKQSNSYWTALLICFEKKRCFWPFGRSFINSSKIKPDLLFSFPSLHHYSQDVWMRSLFSNVPLINEQREKRAYCFPPPFPKPQGRAIVLYNKWHGLAGTASHSILLVLLQGKSFGSAQLNVSSSVSAHAPCKVSSLRAGQGGLVFRLVWTIPSTTINMGRHHSRAHILVFTHVIWSFFNASRVFDWKDPAWLQSDVFY